MFKSLIKLRYVSFALSVLLLSACNDDAPSSLKSTLDEGHVEKPNIIIVMTDDQGYGDFGHNDNPIVQTPNLDEIAQQSTRFTQFHVDPTCSPTRAAMMSGQYSLRAGVWHTVMGRYLLSNDIETLPEYLKKAGYSTAIVGKWHLGDNYPFRPQDQGFDHVLMHGAGGVGQAADYWGNTQFDDTYYLNGVAKSHTGYATDIWFDEAINYIEDNADKEQPFFLYLSTNAPHAPFRAPQSYIDRYLELGVPKDVALFYAMITNLDDNMARLRTAMNETGVTDNTIFIFMTDNGSVMADKLDRSIRGDAKAAIENAIGSKIGSLNFGMRGGKNTVYEGGHRVPFYISWPNGGIDSDKDIQGLAAHFDMMPTLLDLVGADISSLKIDGISLKSALLEGAPLPDRTITVTTQRVLDPDPKRPFAVMNGDWRFLKADGDKEKLQLFNLNEDPQQQNNVIQQYPEIAKNLSDEYQSWWQDVTSKGVPTMRVVIGAPSENPSRLTSHDWFAPSTHQVGHTVGFGNDKWAKRGWLGKESKYPISPWKVNVERAGQYIFSLYLHDKPAEKVIDKKYAHLSVNGKVHTQEIAQGSIAADIAIELESGEADIEAWFSDTRDNSDKPLAVFYLYAERIDHSSKVH